MERKKKGLAGVAGYDSSYPDLLPQCPSASLVESRASRSPALSEVQEAKLIKKVVRSQRDPCSYQQYILPFLFLPFLLLLVIVVAIIIILALCLLFFSPGK